MTKPRKTQAERCMFCEKEATHLCDFAIAMVDGGSVKPPGKPPYPITTIDAMLSTSYTCDAPFCSEHGRMVGHWCGGEPGSIDHCKGCFDSQRKEGARGVLPPSEIENIRRQMHSEYRRSRVRVAR